MILVIGATGNIGPHLVRTLAASKRKVRVAARQVDRAKQLIGDVAVEWAHADLEKPDSLRAALAGVDAVFCGVGGAGCVADLDRVEGAFIEQCAAAKVRQYVKISGIDSALDSPSDIQRLHARIEAGLARTGMAHTVLRPSFFMQNFFGLAGAIKAGQLPMPTGSARAGLIDARDIAETIASVLSAPEHIGKTYTLTGPRSLDHAACAQIFATVLERPVAFVDLPPQAWEGALVQAGLPAWFAHRLTDVYATVFAAGLVDRVTDDVERITGRASRGLETFVRDHRAVFA